MNQERLVNSFLSKFWNLFIFPILAKWATREIVCYTAVFSVVTVRDDTKNGGVADYKREWSSSFSLVSQEKRFMNVKFPKKILSRRIEIWTQEGGKICIFLREFLHGFLKKFWKFIILPFLAKWAKKSVDGRSIILQIPYLK